MRYALGEIAAKCTTWEQEQAPAFSACHTENFTSLVVFFTFSAVFFQILKANREKTQRIVKWPIDIIPIINIQI